MRKRIQSLRSRWPRERVRINSSSPLKLLPIFCSTDEHPLESNSRKVKREVGMSQRHNPRSAEDREIGLPITWCTGVFYVYILSLHRRSVRRVQKKTFHVLYGNNNFIEILVKFVGKVEELFFMFDKVRSFYPR